MRLRNNFLSFIPAMEDGLRIYRGLLLTCSKEEALQAAGLQFQALVYSERTLDFSPSSLLEG